VRHAAAVLIIVTMAIAFATALRCVQGLIYRHNNIGNTHFLWLTRQGVASAGTASTLNDIKAAQLAK
jgi:hypothetical protein